ncbi:hypothetical protein NORO109296_01085 [Nocardiopsis rhodophaea]
MFEDGLVEGGELRAWLHTEFLREMNAQVLVIGEGFALSASAVQGTDVCRAQTLAEGVTRYQVAQLADQWPMFSQFQAGFRLFFQREEALFLQARDHGTSELRVGEVSECWAPPQCEGVSKKVGPGAKVHRCTRTSRQILEAPDVHGFAGDHQLVPRGPRDHQVTAPWFGVVECTPQLGHLRLEGANRIGGKAHLPQIIDQPVGGHRSTVVRQEIGEHGADLQLRNFDRSPVGCRYLQWTEYPEAHGVTIARQNS